ncbi:LysM peptidoglycan-binding domain-containing M23 family metallopeptidase [Paenibacillus radicis (ex Xue et al. 2023)]|uniref:Peptidoglycan DD-metalloendopeptidase family protein n=1 Tax=Paenibacillus radicis (ex Xue et al. 2023) TaxID=2972489 RepID=A0ABT1YMX8_9BACL|nr:M23 family metallopeptidase [Paenibacillus radicis (ex Xue et al. 2023)]MCR8634524.1 peptidoglycan DD-metalloendopeptidase family protein [Paenibacillus radicis (ex Xue et al. 2023)]
MDYTTGWKIEKKWILSCGSLAVIAFFLAIVYMYTLQHTVTRYRVIIGMEAVGTVSSPNVVWDWFEQKKTWTKQQYPTVQAEAKLADLQFIEEREYKAAYDNSGVIAELEKRIRTQMKGVQIRIDDKPLGVVKDEAAAQQLLEQVKQKMSKASTNGKVRILSESASSGVVTASATESEHKLEENMTPMFESVQFVQKVDFVSLEIKPEDIGDSDAMLRKVETGDVQPFKYKVVSGDCVSCIAYKLKINKQVIYDNNPWIKNNLIRVGDVLDLTVLQPLLSVKTIEKRIESFEVPYEVAYVEDSTMKAGLKETLFPGETGLKEVTYLTTRINGDFKEEMAAAETILRPSVQAIVRKGTKVIPGVGTGTLAWPIYRAKLTSEFGKRWGAFHPGTDMVSENKTIMAADHGKTVFAGWKNGYGNCIIIDHQNGLSTLYGHLSKLSVSEGEIVQKGEKIGIMGTTGNSTGVHLHFEVHKGDEQENPLNYLGSL